MNLTNLNMLNIEEKSLHLRFQKLGKNRRELTYQLLEILPEIFKKRIYKKLEFNSIYEYASKIAGLEKGVVKKCLNLEDKLHDKAKLKQAIGEVGVHKVALVTGVTTTETEVFWADKVKNTSKKTLQAMVKEERAFRKEHKESLYGTENAEKYECRAADEKVKIELDKEMQVLFFGLKQGLGTNLSNKEALKKILKHFPGEKACVYPNCTKPAVEVHHPKRVSEEKNNENLKLVCKIHHEFAHNGLIQNENAEKWKYSKQIAPTKKADILYRNYKMVRSKVSASRYSEKSPSIKKKSASFSSPKFPVRSAIPIISAPANVARYKASTAVTSPS